MITFDVPHNWLLNTGLTLCISHAVCWAFLECLLLIPSLVSVQLGSIPQLWVSYKIYKSVTLTTLRHYHHSAKKERPHVTNICFWLSKAPLMFIIITVLWNRSFLHTAFVLDFFTQSFILYIIAQILQQNFANKTTQTVLLWKGLINRVV